MSFYLYRINGGEVLGMSVASYGSLPSQYAEIQNPTETDGPGLSPAKIKDVSSIRNATGAEIANFAVAAAADDKALIISTNKPYLDAGSFAQPLVRALASVVLDEINLLRQWTDDFKTQVAAAASLSDLKTRVASLSALSQRTGSQVITAVKNKMDALT